MRTTATSCDFTGTINNPNNKLVQYRANVHIFGNKSSPSVAIYGLRYTMQHQRADDYPEAKNFIFRNFYMDDGLGCANSTEQAVQILKQARKILSPYNIHLHKIASSSSDVLSQFPESERAVDLNLLEFEEADLQ